MPLGQFVGLEYMRWWQALALLAALSLPIVVLGMRSLAGLGPGRRWVAIGGRLAVLLVIVLLLAGLQIRQKVTDLEVMVLRDVSDSAEQLYRDYPGANLTASLDEFLARASKVNKPANDRIGEISFKDASFVESLPNQFLMRGNRTVREPGGTTDAAGAIQLALATFQSGRLHRILLVWDGNQTSGGNLEAAVAAAAAQNVPIDVMPLNYSVQNEVMVERIDTGKTWRREGESFTLSVHLKSTNPVPVTGRLTILHNDTPLEPEPRLVTLPPAQMRNGQVEPRIHIEQVRVPELKSGGVHEFKALFDQPNVSATVGGNGGPAGKIKPDTLAQNNIASSFVFVRGRGKVLFVDGVAGDGEKYMVDALRSGGIDLEVINPDAMPADLVRMQSYDAVILANIPRDAIGAEGDAMLSQYVHNMGGGLVMLGGDNSFGAGGWQDSKVADVLPVNMDVPAQRQIPKGALVLVMHSCEMPNGNYWGQQSAIKAVESLSDRDEVGIISYDWNVGGAGWDFPLQEKGNTLRVANAINAMKLGDMPSFEDCMQLALKGGPGQKGLLGSNAARKHVIVISDGDPQQPNAATLKAFVDAKITVSTVSVYPHGGAVPGTMAQISKITGGTAYGPIESNPNKLPQIFIKEAVIVRRSLIQTDDKGIPVSVRAPSELTSGIATFPPVFGYVLTTQKKAGVQIDLPLVVTVYDKANKQQTDPLLASWQTGLGRAVAFTSDAHNLWGANWLATADYGKIWLQVVRSVQRPPMSTDFEVRTTREGPDKVRVTVEALQKDSKFLNFLDIQGQTMGPEGAQNVKLTQTGPGLYTATFDARSPGNYVTVLSYGGAEKSGILMTGIAMNQSPELRDLRSNDSRLQEIVTRTGGRMLDPWDVPAADLFSRENIPPTRSPLPVRDTLLPLLIALLLIDVAVRRLALDRESLRRAAVFVADRVRAWTLSRKVESGATLDALKRVRDEVAETRFKTEEGSSSAGGTPPPMPDPKAKFEAKGVEGDITAVVGGATDKPLPSAPKKVEPKAGPSAGGHTGSLLEAKRRAQAKIREKEHGGE